MKEQKSRKAGIIKKKKSAIMYRTYVMIFVAFAITFLSSFFYSRAFANDNAQPAAYKYYTSIEVESGDTLWSIATRYADEEYVSIEDYISELKYMNNMNSDTIIEGHYLTVAYYSDEYK